MSETPVERVKDHLDNAREELREADRELGDLPERPRPAPAASWVRGDVAAPGAIDMSRGGGAPGGGTTDD